MRFHEISHNLRHHVAKRNLGRHVFQQLKFAACLAVFFQDIMVPIVVEWESHGEHHWEYIMNNPHKYGKMEHLDFTI